MPIAGLHPRQIIDVLAHERGGSSPERIIRVSCSRRPDHSGIGSAREEIDPLRQFQTVRLAQEKDVAVDPGDRLCRDALFGRTRKYSIPNSAILRRVSGERGGPSRGVTATTSRFAKRPPKRRRLSTIRSVSGSRIPDSIQTTTVIEGGLATTPPRSC